MHFCKSIRGRLLVPPLPLRSNAEMTGKKVKKMDTSTCEFLDIQEERTISPLVFNSHSKEPAVECPSTRRKAQRPTIGSTPASSRKFPIND